MRLPIATLLFLLPLISASSVSAQLVDVIDTINGESVADLTTKYFNIANCEDPSTTTFVMSLSNTVGSTLDGDWVWVSAENTNCEDGNTRTNSTTVVCTEATDPANPQAVGTDNLVTMTLSQLTSPANSVFDCSASGLRGTRYDIFNFRVAPGNNTIDPANFGIAPVTIDVVAPNPPDVTSSDLRGSTFTIRWNSPNPADDLEEYLFFQNSVDDRDGAVQIAGETANQDATSKTISASALGLAEDESAFVFVAAVDMALNVGERSRGVMVTAIPTQGFCGASGECDGCTATRLSPARAASTWGLLTILALLGLVCVRRLVR